VVLLSPKFVTTFDILLSAYILFTYGERQKSTGAGAVVFSAPTLSEFQGENTTRPSGTNTDPEKSPDPVVVELAYDKATGSNIPTFADENGQKTMFPVGVRHPPANPEVAATLDHVPTAG
jgi:hypothetical protein